MISAEKRRWLAGAGAIALSLITSITFGTGVHPARAMSPQASSEPSNTAEQFAGTWHWMFDGRSFSTMVLVRDGSGFTGTVTPTRIALNDNGGLLRADPGEDATPQPIARVRLEGSALHITVADGFQFVVSLKDDTHAEIHPIEAPPNMKPIPAVKIR